MDSFLVSVSETLVQSLSAPFVISCICPPGYLQHHRRPKVPIPDDKDLSSQNDLSATETREGMNSTREVLDSNFGTETGYTGS
jgi:hypothetical protein